MARGARGRARFFPRALESSDRGRDDHARSLIARFGVPAFIKIDVEGGEPAVLGGLTRPVPALSFEYLPRALDQVDACVTYLTALGPYQYNWSSGESYSLASASWLTAGELSAALSAPEAQQRSGDVYARLWT